MYLLNKLLVTCVLLLSSVSALAFDCTSGGSGHHCVWGFDKNKPDELNLIDRNRLEAFCDNNKIYCSNYNNGYNSIVGRYLNNDIFMITGQGWGGPDLILENKKAAEQFATEFKAISPNPDTRFFVKDDSYPTRKIIAIGYKEKSSEGFEEIKLLILPNEWDEIGDDHGYVPPDE